MASKKRRSAGILMYRIKDGNFEVFLAHPGGPYFAKKDDGHWSIPKGEPEEGEDMLIAAIREFKEETGIKASGNFLPLGSIVQKGGKEVFAWALEGDLPKNFVHECNMIEIQWPPRSGKFLEFPEIDKVEFFDVTAAKKKIKDAQIPFIETLEKFLLKPNQNK
jgi:predicted NUDIX family NTP pyrophosphohydrolase